MVNWIILLSAIKNSLRVVEYYREVKLKPGDPRPGKKSGAFLLLSTIPQVICIGVEMMGIDINSYMSEAERRAKEAQDKAQAKTEEEAKKRHSKRRKILMFIGIGLIVGIVLAIFIGHAVVVSNRSTYSSEAEMKAALQGTYTYTGDYSFSDKQIIIDGDTVTYKASLMPDGLNYEIKKWDYKNGKIQIKDSYTKDITVTKEGYLKDSYGNIHVKGGTLRPITKKDLLGVD